MCPGLSEEKTNDAQPLKEKSVGSSTTDRVDHAFVSVLLSLHFHQTQVWGAKALISSPPRHILTVELTRTLSTGSRFCFLNFFPPSSLIPTIIPLPPQASLLIWLIYILKYVRILGTSLVAQWLRICLSMQGTWV